MKRRVTLVHFSSYPAGIEVLLPGIIRGCDGFAFSAFVIRPQVKGNPDIYSSLDIKVRYGSANTPIALIKLFAYALGNRNDIYHVFNIGPLFLLMLRLAGVRRLVYSIHGTQYWKSNNRKKIFIRIWRAAMRRNYIMTSNSIYSGRVFNEKVIPRKEIELLYNPIDNKRFVPPEKRKSLSSPVNIIYCGRLDKGKNLDEWIKIASAVKMEYPDTVFRLYGDGAEKEHLLKLITANNASGYISIEGFVPDPERVYTTADLMIFISDYESFGNVVVESVLCGTPVIAGDIPSMKEIFSEFPGLLMDKNNLPAEVLKKMGEYNELVDITGQARESFITRFDPVRHIVLLKKIYDRLPA